MPRPSRNIDRQLIETGIEMLKESGLKQLNIRELVKRAGVNLGMFHYHFKTKDAYAQIMLQEVYERIFAKLSAMTEIGNGSSTLSQLRDFLYTIATFLRDHRNIVISILSDVTLGAPVMVEFARKNFPRHIVLLRGLVARAQKDKKIVDLPLPQIMSFLAGAVAAPLVAAGIVLNSVDDEFKWIKPVLDGDILSDQAIKQRIDMALKGVSL